MVPSPARKWALEKDVAKGPEKTPDTNREPESTMIHNRTQMPSKPKSVEKPRLETCNSCAHRKKMPYHAKPKTVTKNVRVRTLRISR